MLVKSIDLPSYSMQMETKHKYNRKKNVQTRLDYDPINVTFHDDNFGVTTLLWEAYYRYYFKDGNYTTFDASGSLGSVPYAQQLNAIQTTIDDLRAQFASASNDVQIKLLRFASNVSDFPDGAATGFDLNDAALDDVLALAPFTGGTTNYLATLRAANTLF